MALFCLFLAVVHGYRPDESNEAKEFGLNLENSGLEYFKNDIQANEPLNKHFDDLKDYLETVQENNKLLDIKSKKIVEEVKILSETIKTDPLNVVSITKLDQLITDFAKKSAENYHIYGHSLQWLEKRIKLNILSEKLEINRMNNELREAKNALHRTKLIIDAEIQIILKQIMFLKSYIEGSTSGKQTYSDQVVQLTKETIQSKLNIIMETIQRINLSGNLIDFTNQAVKIITNWATQETK